MKQQTPDQELRIVDNTKNRIANDCNENSICVILSRRNADLEIPNAEISFQKDIKNNLDESRTPRYP